MRGFTLIESLIYIAIFTIIIIAIYQFAISFYNSNTFRLQQTQAISEGRTILSEMSREIKEMVHSKNIRNNQIFTYYNSFNQLVPDLNILTDISLIEINLQVNINPFAAPGDFTLKTIVKPRNLD